MEIKTIEEKKETGNRVICVHEVNLKVGDGIRFGFGFGMGMFLWGVAFFFVAAFGLVVLITPLISKVKLF